MDKNLQLKGDLGRNKSKNLADTAHIDVLDGIRAVAVLIVAWFHFWQQSWLMPVGFGINADWIPRTGYEMVDMLILISGFCLFLPHARTVVLGEKAPDTGQFYKKRAARILPSYLFCILVIMLVFNIPFHAYQSAGELLKDLITHLTFTHTFFTDTYMNTKLNGVLWTIAVEVQFYLVFPYIARKFREHPIPVYIIMTGISLLFNSYITSHYGSLNFSMVMNQLPAFLGVYANGMMGALIFVSMGNRRQREKYEGIFFTGLALFCLFMYKVLMKDLCRSGTGVVWQVNYRYLVSILFIVFIISSAFALDAFRFLLSNRLMRFLSGISFNFYIWHAFLAVKLKEFRIPFWSGDEPPNKTGDKVWMWKYFILIWAAAFAAAVITTYGIEKPMARLILNRKKRVDK